MAMGAAIMDEIKATRQAIGGYHELSLGRGGRDLHPDALHLQSARACFLALLLTGRPRKVWLPWYICETMVDQARAASVDVARYGIDEAFDVAQGVELDPGDWLLYVNYFGMCDAQVDRVLARFGPGQVVIDNSHALYSRPRECLASIYSPRKFVGLPDGGCLVSRLPVPLPEVEDQASVWRCVPLLVRAADCAENGYAEYLKSQLTLESQLPMRMSRLTKTFMDAIDYTDVAARRRANFAVLDELLSGANRCGLRLDGDAVPLNYPFIGADRDLRSRLLAHRVYAPRFWPHLQDAQAEVPAFERFLARECIPLPCDQRYDAVDMAEVAGLVRRHASD
jgi:hypothetical protein